MITDDNKSVQKGCILINIINLTICVWLQIFSLWFMADFAQQVRNSICKASAVRSYNYLQRVTKLFIYNECVQRCQHQLCVLKNLPLVFSVLFFFLFFWEGLVSGLNPKLSSKVSEHYNNLYHDLGEILDSDWLQGDHYKVIMDTHKDISVKLPDDTSKYYCAGSMETLSITSFRQHIMINKDKIKRSK